MKIFYWLFFIACPFFLKAQDVVFKYEKKFRKGTQPKSYHSYTAIDDSTGDIHLTIVDNKSIERFVMDSNWHIKNHFDEVRGAYAQFPYDRFTTLQMLNNGGNELNIYNTQDKKFDINRIDYQKGEEVNISKFELGKHEFVTACFTASNAYCLVVSNNKSDELKFLVSMQGQGSELRTITVPLNLPESDVRMNKLLQDIVVLDEDERDLEKLVSKKKIYIYGNTVHISADETNATYLTSVHLETGKVDHNIFIQQYTGEFPKKKQTQVYNSFLLDNVLVNGNVYNGNLSVSFYDITKGSLITNYSTHFKDSIDFKNGLIYNKKNKAIDAEEFIDRIINSGQLVFDLSKKDEHFLELVVENCDIKKAKNFSSGGVWMGGGNINTPGGVVALPSTFHSTSFWGNGEVTFKKDVYFKSVVNSSNFEHAVETNNSKSKSTLLEDELSELNENSALSIFRKNGITYLGFYDDKQEAFIIKKIGN